MKGKIIIQVPKTWTEADKEKFSKDLSEVTSNGIYDNTTILIMSTLDVNIVDVDTMDKMRK